MTLIPTTSRPLGSTPAAEQVELGAPGVDGRWQPTRAGVLNSWAWADETLLFANGWLALAGPNGSGKSLTASMLVTLLLDGDSGQLALSVSGKASGTLHSRHTDRNENEDRTGSWWLEYGMRAADGTVRYLTTGLWLRSTVGSIHRAFFVVDGRVGRELQLSVARVPVDIGELSEQLAAASGRLFTSSDKLRRKASAVLPVADESGYRQAIRTRLFAPLDEVQFDALISVLRSLRSVRTAEAISPNDMRRVLKEALPALDSARLSLVAEAMQRISDLEQKLRETRAQEKALAQTDQRYRRYVEAVVGLEAARLTAAVTAFDDVRRSETEATTKLEKAGLETQAVEAARQTNQTQTSAAEGKRNGVYAQMQQHAGAELPVKEVHLTQLREYARSAAGRASTSATRMSSAQERHGKTVRDTIGAQTQLRRLTDPVAEKSGVLGGAAAFERLLSVSAALARRTPGEEIDPPDIARLGEGPEAWLEMRRGELSMVGDALIGHAVALSAQRAAGERVQECDAEVEAISDRLRVALLFRRDVQQELLDEIARWTAGRVELPAPPAKLIDPESRVEANPLDEWLIRAASSTRERINRAGAEGSARELRRYAQRSRAAAGKRDEQAEQAEAADAEQQRAFRDAGAVHGAQLERARSGRDEAEQQRRTKQDAAERTTTEAEQILNRGRQAAVEAARDWVAAVAGWRDRLEVLPRTLPLPDAAEDVDPPEVRTRVAALTSDQVAALRGEAAGLKHRISAAERDLRRLEDDLDKARESAPTPPAPAWRAPRSSTAGAPFWSLVDFAADVDEQAADRIEGALLTAGLLDGWVSLNGQLRAGDVVLSPAAPTSGPALSELLVADPDAVGGAHGVQAEQLDRLLRSMSLDTAAGTLAAGQLALGVLHAAAPEGYQASYIGRSRRERSRLARVAAIGAELITVEEQIEQLSSRHDELLSRAQQARAESSALPSAEPVAAARRRVTDLLLALSEARTRTAQQLADAAATYTTRIAEADEVVRLSAERLRLAGEAAQQAEREATERRRQASEAQAEAGQDEEHALTAEQAFEQAVRTQQRADTEQSLFPSLGTVRETDQDEEAAERDLRQARSRLEEARQHAEQTGQAVKAALQRLNSAASLPDGTMLPTQRQALDRYGSEISELGKAVQGWRLGAERAVQLLRGAATATADLAGATADRQQAEDDAQNLKRDADKLEAEINEIRRLFGASYEALQQQLRDQDGGLTRLRAELRELNSRAQKATLATADARRDLSELEPRKLLATDERAACVDRMRQLVGYGLAEVFHSVPIDEAGKPANLTAATTWARLLLSGRAGDSSRLTQLTEARNRALTALESSARLVNGDLIRYDQQVVVDTLNESLDWRRATLAAPNALTGTDLRDAVAGLKATVSQLENDLRSDIKETLQTSLFTQLRSDIQQRRELARELVRRIRATLEGVRTGVANVGVEVDWVVRDDPDAQRMVELITAPPSDQTFSQMYETLRQRLSDADGDTWAERVGQTFDYRSWHEWEIKITHASFGEPGKEAFKLLTPRSNPLASLSTGESRLATMLPLLAAAWSTYSAIGYCGPRLLSIDEIDAAFDDANLRQVLALLRSWDFDVLATAPSISPLIKRESEQVVVHELISAGVSRITVPWLWRGQGEPEPLTLELFSDPAAKPDAAARG